MKSKVITVQVEETEELAETLEGKLNEFLGSIKGAEIHNVQCQMFDIGGPSRACILVLYTIIYSE